jgi:hypothetical protein
MYYIVVIVDRVPKVVSNMKGTPRTFPKHKKARNFIDSRRYLKSRNPQVVESIEGITERFRIDL